MSEGEEFVGKHLPYVIGRGLAAEWAGLVHEPLPENFRRLATQLEVSAASPAPADENAPFLDEWRTVPVLGRPDRFALAGRCTGHPRYGDTSLRTSAVIVLDLTAGWARTQGTVYRLGEPAFDR
jgi:hypothetical protein